MDIISVKVGKKYDKNNQKGPRPQKRACLYDQRFVNSLGKGNT